MSPPPIISQEVHTDNRVQILDAAEARYRDVGYEKTTMAEIASDVGMSAANLYRYFKNKHEIGYACAQRCMQDRIEVLREIVKLSTLDPAVKLRQYVIASFDTTFENAGQDAKLDGLVQRILGENRELVIEKIEQQISLITEILHEGVEQNVFDIDDVSATARNIQTSIVLFDVPIFMGLYSLEEFHALANGVVDLALAAIKRKT